MLKRIFTVLALVSGMAAMLNPTITLAAQVTPSHGKLQVIDNSQVNPGDSPVVPDNQGNAGYGNIAPASPGDDNSTNAPDSSSNQSTGDGNNPGALSDPNAGASPGLSPPDDNSAVPSPTDATPTSSDPNTSVDNSSE